MLKKEIISEIKRLLIDRKNQDLEKRNKELLKYLKKLINEELASVEDFFNFNKEQENHHIPATVFFALAVGYEKGTFFTKNLAAAQHIYYCIAGILPKAKLRYAISLFKSAGNSNTNNNASLALDILKDLLNKLTDPNYEGYGNAEWKLMVNKTHYWLGRIYFQDEQIRNYTKALEHSFQVAEPMEKEAQSIIKKIILFSVQQHFELRDSPKPKKHSLPQGWHQISETLQGYDVSETNLTDLENELAEHKKAKKELKKFQAQYEQALEIGEDQNKIITLQLKVDYAAKVLSMYKSKDLLNPKIQQLTYAALRKEFQRAYKVEERFFRPQVRNSYKRSKNLTQDLLLSRFTGTPKTIDLTGIPPRRIIKAERAALEISRQLSFHGEHRNILGWLAPRTEEVLIDGTVIQITHNPIYTNHLGNCEVEITSNPNASYNVIIQILLKACQSDGKKPNLKAEQRLVEYMFNYAKTGKMITLPELQTINPDADDHLLQKIREIFFLIMVKEISRRSAPDNAKYNFPAASMLIRSLKLVTAGKLSLNDIFKTNASYGISSIAQAFNNHGTVVATINRINKTYDMAFYKETNKTKKFFEEHPKAVAVSTRKEFKLELRDSYGMESDTEDGYESSEDLSPSIELL